MPRRRIYWAHASHIRDRRMILLDHKRKFTGMVRVKIEVLK